MPPRLPTKVAERTRRALFGLSTPSSKNLPAVIPDTPVLERIIRTPRTRRKFLKDVVRTVSAKLAPRLPLDILSRLPLPGGAASTVVSKAAGFSAGLPAVAKLLSHVNTHIHSPIMRNVDTGVYLNETEVEKQDFEKVFDFFVDDCHQSDPGKGLRDAPGGKHHDWPFPQAEAALAKLSEEEAELLAEIGYDAMSDRWHETGDFGSLSTWKYKDLPEKWRQKISEKEFYAIHSLLQGFTEEMPNVLDEYLDEKYTLPPGKTPDDMLDNPPSRDPMGYDERDKKGYNWSKDDVQKYYENPDYIPSRNYDPTTEPDYTAPLEKLDRRNVMQQTPLRLLNMLAGGLRDKTEEVPRIAYDTVDETVREGGVHPDTPKDIAREAHREVDKAMNKAGLHENTLRDTIRDDFVPWVRGLFK